MRYKFKHQYVLSIKVYFPKCSPYLQVSSWASSWAQMVGSFENGHLKYTERMRVTGSQRCSNRKGKASCSSLHLYSHLIVGTLREIFARIKCRSVHKKISLLKENQTMGIQSYHIIWYFHCIENSLQIKSQKIDSYMLSSQKHHDLLISGETS